MRDWLLSPMVGYTAPMLDAIVFDFDGVIVDTEPVHYRAFLEVVGPMGVDFGYDHYLREYVGYDDRDGFRAMCGEIGVEPDEARLAELIRAKAEAFIRLAGQTVEPFPGVVELIESSSVAMPIAICSGALRSDIEAALAGIGDGRLLDRFAAVVTAEEVARSKPDPQSYALAVERLGVLPGSALAIEDTPAGLVSARDAGLRTLGVTTTHPAEELEIAERIVPSLGGVTPEQLQSWYG